MNSLVKKYRMIHKLKTAPVEHLGRMVMWNVDDCLDNIIVLRDKSNNLCYFECHFSKHVMLSFTVPYDKTFSPARGNIEIRCRRRIIRRGDIFIPYEIMSTVGYMMQKMKDSNLIVHNFNRYLY